ncbi:unnamed protein product [Linum trigynum]|uniref:DUF4283 domain-containing protein n=1 Tax=Linum trigynum TaxID=586398 RepID=A0AAV2D691_9ROSI
MEAREEATKDTATSKERTEPLELEAQLNNITLEEDDEEPLEVEDSDVDVLRMEAVRRLGLIGHLVSEKEPNIKSMKISLAKAWKLRKGFQITELGDMLFAFQFLEMDDRNKVCFGGPWHYENSLIVFKISSTIQKPKPEDLHMIDLWIRILGFPAELRTQQMAEKIAKRFGGLDWFDNGSSTMWDDYMRLRVNISINNPLKKKLKLNIAGKLVEFQVKYEKLPMFCYSCGRIGYPKLKCKTQPKPEVDPYGYDLRVAAPGPRNWLSYTAKKEDAEVWAALKQKFEMESIGSNSDHDMALEQEENRVQEEVQPLAQQREESKHPNNQIPPKEQLTQRQDKQNILANTVQNQEKKERQQAGALQKFVMGSVEGKVPGRNNGRVWRRQEVGPRHPGAGVHLTPQKRHVAALQAEIPEEQAKEEGSKKARKLQFSGQEQVITQQNNINVDGGVAESAQEQTRPAQ